MSAGWHSLEEASNPPMRIAILAIVIIAALGVAGLTIFAWEREIEPIAPPSAAEFDEEMIAYGARLSALGNCVDCHTAPGREAYAGGYPMNTPYGVIYGTNITPDPETGIGNWSEAAFARAMRQGVDREGRHLYPAFPDVSHRPSAHALLRLESRTTDPGTIPRISAKK
jgi:mono/diheme cytochrome c family protein